MKTVATIDPTTTITRMTEPILRTMQVTIALTLALSAVGATTRPSMPVTRPAPGTKPAPATRRAERPERVDRNPAIQSAIVELTKEIESALRSDGDAPREQCNYFQDHPATELPAGAITAALRRPISNDARVAAYVKWQLLSGLPRDIDAKTAAELVQAYHAAPAPLPRPGIEKDSRDDLERLVRNAKANDEEQVSDRFEQRVKSVERENLHILAFRDALFSHLPPSYEATVAGFEDAVARLDAGAEVRTHVRAVCKTASEWAAAIDPPPAPDQLKAMSLAMAKLQKEKGSEYYTKVYLSKAGKLQWSKGHESFAGIAQLDELREFLDDRIKNPSTPLKLKESK